MPSQPEKSSPENEETEPLWTQPLLDGLNEADDATFKGFVADLKAGSDALPLG